MDIFRRSPLQRQLLGKLIGLARAMEGNEDLVSDSTTIVIREGLLAALAEESKDDTLSALAERVTDEKRKLIPNCFYCTSPCGRNDDYDPEKLKDEEVCIRDLKLSILSGLHDLAAAPDTREDTVCKALVAIGIDGLSEGYLRSVLQELGTV